MILEAFKFLFDYFRVLVLTDGSFFKLLFFDYVRELENLERLDFVFDELNPMLELDGRSDRTPDPKFNEAAVSLS